MQGAPIDAESACDFGLWNASGDELARFVELRRVELSGSSAVTAFGFRDANAFSLAFAD